MFFTTEAPIVQSLKFVLVLSPLIGSLLILSPRDFDLEVVDV